MNEQSLFAQALEISDPVGRSAFLDRACQGNHVLFKRIGHLLERYASIGSFLEQSAGESSNTVTVNPDTTTNANLPGTLVGPYKLIQEIGEGGMGTVFLAQQAVPVKRMVALKVIKSGMDTKQVLARFEAERQALALMDHPNIARVLDASATQDGRPYFVMELVKGVPLTRYCDDQQLLPNDRLELFVQVCHAVQHAHQKGIIHRDLKPSNVLVAPYDGKPVVKVIDFGVAKATGQPLTDSTLVTGIWAVIGTPEYMSPEQAEVNNQDIDTRSDVYSLGVLLYELLTGTTPLTRSRVKGAALLDVLRLVREDETLKPSSRLSTIEELPSVAAKRGVEPRKLSGLIRGDLDWIVMKALEKDRSRRYETANGFAMDVQRYLADEPVQACPPSAWYRFRKFARRNKTGVAVAVAAVLVVLIAVVGLAVGNVLIGREKDQTAAALEQSLENEKAYKAQLLRANENLRLAIKKGEMTFGSDMMYLDLYQDLTFHQYLLPEESNALRQSLQVYLEFAAVNNDGQSAPLEMASTWERLSYFHLAFAEYRAAEQILRPAVALLEDLNRIDPKDPTVRWRLVENYTNLAMALEKQGRCPEAEEAYRQALRLEADILERRDRYAFAGDRLINQCLGWGRIFFGRLLLRTGRPLEAEPAFRKGLTFGDSPLLHSIARDGLGRVCQSAGRFREAEEEYREASRMWKKLLMTSPGNRHYLWKVAAASQQLGEFYQATGRDKETGEEYQKALKIWEDLNSNYPTVPAYPRQLAWFLAAAPVPELRDPAQAVVLAGKATELAPNDGHNWTTLAVARYRTGNWSEAQVALEKAMNLRPCGEGLDWFLLAMVRWRIGDEGNARRWYDKAVEWMAKHDVYNDDLRRLQVEAAELLKLFKK